MTTAHGFPPIARDDATILVLGTMPGKASLAAGQYYAHARNTFWKLAGTILGIDPALPYDERVSGLVAARIAVWDVLQLCTRETSLDSDIVDPIPNTFGDFFATHPQIDRVCFNGSAAYKLYETHVQPGLTTTLDYRRLPSTSPANASIPFDAKLALWTAALRR